MYRDWGGTAGKAASVGDLKHQRLQGSQRPTHLKSLSKVLCLNRTSREMFSHAQSYRHLEAYEALTQGAQLPLELAAKLSVVPVVYRFCFVLYCTYTYVLYYIVI